MKNNKVNKIKHCRTHVGELAVSSHSILEKDTTAVSLGVVLLIRTR